MGEAEAYDGEMAGLAHEKYVWGTLWDQECSKSETLEEGDNHQIWFRASLGGCYYLLMGRKLYWIPLVCGN